MKEIPILFSTPMVKAIIDGSKTMTRRVIKDKDAIHVLGKGHIDNAVVLSKFRVGDLLWVKETFFAYGQWIKNGISKTGKQKFKFQDLTGTDFQYKYFDTKPDRINKSKTDGIGWYKKPAIFMPKKAARIWLEVVSVKAERLQDITEEDARKEGVQYNPEAPASFTNVGSFAKLWESINGKGSWEENPGVRVVEFKKIEKQQ